MHLSTLDWAIVAAFFLISLLIGLWASKRGTQDFASFFLSGRQMPWWLLGFSMVATTFAADTPNLVTGIVRQNGVAGNWVWWGFLLTGMLTVFVYAKLWRRSGVFTDLEFYELRYSGGMASFLRGFRSVYLGFFFNLFVMANVCLAGIKIGAILLGLNPYETLIIASVITVLYSTLGGLFGILLTDFFQFLIAMLGAVLAAVYIVNLPEVGGLDQLLAQAPVVEKMNFFPDFSDPASYIPLLVIPLAVQWWSSWYPGAEPGGGGYIAQRMLAAKNERHATGATLFFNLAHYALRPWPWILVALASLLLFPIDLPEARQEATRLLQSPEMAPLAEAYQKSPDALSPEQRESVRTLLFQEKGLSSLRQAFPEDLVPDGKLEHDLAYPAMMRRLPTGLLGLLVASLIAAFMSTISTHLNWGSSYLVGDLYKRFFRKEASGKELVRVGQLTTVLLMILASLLALGLSDAVQVFGLMVQIGAGTGLIFILRWFWWRVNAYSELAGMVISFIVALTLEFGQFGLAGHEKLLLGVGITTLGWLTATFLTPADSYETLLAFYKKVKPASFGWGPVLRRGLESGHIRPEEISRGKIPLEISCILAGSLNVYSLLFAAGWALYGNTMAALIALSVAALGAWWLWRQFGKVGG